MSLKDYRFDGEEKLELRGMNTGAKKDGVDKEDILRRTEKNLGRIEALQDKLYADGRESVLILLQAMDAAGKDSTVKHVMGCVNPQGIDVHSFNQPTSEELAKNWKFSQADIRERAYWNDYMDAYEVAVNETATRHSPWYVIPADQKWYTRYLVSEAVLGVLEDIDPHYPKLPPEHAAELQECREALENE